MKRISLVFIVLSLVSSQAISDSPNEKKGEPMAEEVAPNEDLMREHGVLNRLLLIYQELVRRIDHRESFPHQIIVDTVKIVRDFVENYHEKLEEEYVFARFEKANQLVDLVKTLRNQHEIGRRLTQYILTHLSEADLKDEMNKMILADYMRLYITMFRPHAAREDTILFPAFRKLLPNDEYMKLGDLFEDKENELFGKEGFDKIVSQVATIEKQLNIYDLSQFTPQLKEKH